MHAWSVTWQCDFGMLEVRHAIYKKDSQQKRQDEKPAWHRAWQLGRLPRTAHSGSWVKNAGGEALCAKADAPLLARSSMVIPQCNEALG